MLLSLNDILSSLDHTSPNKTSSFNSANFGANEPSFSRPAVCFTAITDTSCILNFIPHIIICTQTFVKYPVVIGRYNEKA